MADVEDDVLAFTLRDRRRIDRLDRAVFGYADESGAWVAGILQNTADAVGATKTIRKLVWFLAAIALTNTAHQYGIMDLITKLIAGGK